MVLETFEPFWWLDGLLGLDRAFLGGSIESFGGLNFNRAFLGRSPISGYRLNSLYLRFQTPYAPPHPPPRKCTKAVPCLVTFPRKVLGVFQRPLTLILLQKYRDTNGRRIAIRIGGVYTTFCQEEGILLQKYRDRNGRCIAILFKGNGVRGRSHSPESNIKEAQEPIN